MFFWINAYSKNVTKTSRFLVNLLKMFGGIIIVNIPRIIVSQFEGTELLVNILFYVSGYLTLFWIGTVAIKDQERFINEK